MEKGMKNIIQRIFIVSFVILFLVIIKCCKDIQSDNNNGIAIEQSSYNSYPETSKKISFNLLKLAINSKSSSSFLLFP